MRNRKVANSLVFNNLQKSEQCIVAQDAGRLAEALAEEKQPICERPN